MEDISLELGRRIAEIRKKNNYTQQEVADNIPGITVQMISSYETGKQKPGIENLIKISRFLKVSLDYLCIGKQTVTNAYDIKNYADVIRCCLALEKTGLFKVESRDSRVFDLRGTSRGNTYTLIAVSEILSNFNYDYTKLLQAEDILGKDIFAMTVKTLISKHEEMPLDKAVDSKNINE